MGCQVSDLSAEVPQALLHVLMWFIGDLFLNWPGLCEPMCPLSPMLMETWAELQGSAAGASLFILG